MSRQTSSYKEGMLALFLESHFLYRLLSILSQFKFIFSRISFCPISFSRNTNIIIFSFRVLNLLMYIRVTKFTSLYNKTMESTTKTTSPSLQKEAGYIDLPKEIKSKGAIINVQNKDNRCFEYAILSAQYNKEVDQKHTNRPSKYKEYLGQLNFTGIEFPVSLKDIDKFENQNPEIGVNVYGYDKEVHILRTNKKDPQNAIDLLLITNEEKQHYCWIKNLSRLLSAQVSKHNGKVYFCKRCMRHFSTLEKLNNHLPESIQSTTITTTPSPQKETNYIDLPKFIKAKRAVINVQNKDNDNRSFEYAILSAQHKDKIKTFHHSKPTQYKDYLNKLNFTGIEFPVSLKDIDKFENQNPGIYVNVYSNDKSIHVLRLNKTDPQNAIDLLLITSEEKQHYCWIKNFSRLVKSQVTKTKQKVYFCKSCLKYFYSTEMLDDHLPKCNGNPNDLKQ